LKIDLSSIFLVIIVVIPGLFAQRAKGMLVPKSLVSKGASEELAELVAFGLATHAVLALLAAIVALLAGCITQSGGGRFFRAVDAWNPLGWSDSHRSEALLLCAGYIFLSFFASHCLGLVYGAITVRGGVTARLFEGATWLERFGIRGLLGERPIIYDLLNAELDSNGTTKDIFVEAEMKDGLGFYSGQLDQFAIVRDEETHRPVYLIDVWFSAGSSSPAASTSNRQNG